MGDCEWSGVCICALRGGRKEDLLHTVAIALPHQSSDEPVVGRAVSAGPTSASDW